MLNIVKNCFICCSNRFIKIDRNYLKCTNCGQEYLVHQFSNKNIINEKLTKASIEKLSLLDKILQGIVRVVREDNNYLLDIGSGSGKFLFHNRGFFKKHLGIEVTKACLKFSIKLGLHVRNSLGQIKESISVVTFWHSLEHIPMDITKALLKEIRLNSNSKTRIVVCVPNPDSFLQYMFKEHNPYYDLRAHLYNYSYNSLSTLFKQFGFKPRQMFFIFPYSFFGYWQGLLNLFNSDHNFFYFYKKRGYYSNKQYWYLNLLYLYNVVLGSLLIFPAFILCVLDFLFLKKGGVLTIVFSK